MSRLHSWSTRPSSSILTILFLAALAQPALSAPTQMDPRQAEDLHKPEKRGFFGLGSHGVPHQVNRPRPHAAVLGPEHGEDSDPFFSSEKAGSSSSSSYAGSRPNLPVRPSTSAGSELDLSEEELAYPVCSSDVLYSMGFPSAQETNPYSYSHIQSEHLGGSESYGQAQEHGWGPAHWSTSELGEEEHVESNAEHLHHPRPPSHLSPHHASYSSDSSDSSHVSHSAPSLPTPPRPLLGFAHYPRFRVLADDISGAVPISPESSCLAACRKYGPSCRGVYYDGERGQCWFKGKRVDRWQIVETGEEEDGVNLAGGCARWKAKVGGAMDAVCCRL